MIKITFLGTSAVIPTAERNHVSMLLSCKNENILFDCGEGTQRQIRKARLNLNKITRILISHWHGDHVLGIAGLMETMAFSGYNKTLFIYGPKGTKEFMKNILKTFLPKERIKTEIQEVEGRFLDTEDFYIEAEKMSHGVPCNAYSFIKKGNLRIDKKKLSKTKIHGPILKKLKEGKDILYNGKKYRAKDMTYTEESKKISVVMDTSFNEKIISFVKNSDILVCESTFDEDMKEKAEEYLHLTAKDAAQIAKKSNSKKLILTHISQRYSKTPKKIADSAKKIFKNSYLAKDLDVIEIK